MRIGRKNRISIDQDNFNQLQMLKKYYNMCYISSNVFLKETKHGYHIVGNFPNRTVNQNLNIRTMLNDCKIRLWLDELNVVVDEELIETLFFEKEIRGKKSNESSVNPLSKPFWNIRNHVKVYC